MVVAGRPRHLDVERRKQVEEGPRNHHVVVHADETGDEEHSPPDPCNKHAPRLHLSFIHIINNSKSTSSSTHKTPLKASRILFYYGLQCP